MDIYGGMQMNKIRVIDLLNKIANGEEVPKKIKYENTTYTFHERIPKIYGFVDEQGTYLEEQYYITSVLNHEVEIIEEDKKIEKIEDIYAVDHKWQSENNNMFTNKINELIDEVNK